MVSRYSGCSSYSVALSRYTATLRLERKGLQGTGHAQGRGKLISGKISRRKAFASKDSMAGGTCIWTSKALTSLNNLNKESRRLFLRDNSIWSFHPPQHKKNSPIRRRHPPGPSAPPPPGNPHPLLALSIKKKPTPPLTGALDSPFPLPNEKKNKKYPSTKFWFNCVACCCTQHHPWPLKTGTLFGTASNFDRILVKALSIDTFISATDRHPSSWWTFRPPKKYLAPPPRFPNSLQKTLLETPSPSWKTPPLLGFSIKNRPLPSPGASDSPLPLPEQKKITSTKS